MPSTLSTSKSVLLVHPPLVKPCEPPAGLAKLAGALHANQIDYRVFDANLEGIRFLLANPPPADDTWSKRAVRHVDVHLSELAARKIYSQPSRYKRAVADLNRVLSIAGIEAGVNISLSNYSTPDLSALLTKDLLRAAETFEENPFHPLFRQSLDTFFSDQAPDITGISLNYMSQSLCAFALMGLIKRRFPATRIVLGGGLVTSWMKRPDFGNPFQGLVDDLVSGPGEDHLVEMCGGQGSGALSPSGFRYGSRLSNRYLAPGPILPYSASSGCYWQKCTFCPERSENSSYRPARVRAAGDEVRELAALHRPYLIHFLDNALSPRFLKGLIERPPGAPWYGFVRITDHLTEPEFAAGLRKSGCVMLKLGIESGDQAVLDALQKGVEIQTVSRALHTLKRAGIATYAYLLFGTPAETLSSARKTLDFTLAHAKAIDFLNLAIFNLPAESDEAEQLDTADFYPGDLSLYRDFRHPKGWHRGKVRRFLAKEFKRPRPIRTLLGNDPPFFTSNHAPFFIM